MQLKCEQWKRFQSHSSRGDGVKRRHERLFSDWSAVVLACNYRSYVHVAYTDYFTMVESNVFTPFYPLDYSVREIEI